MDETLATFESRVPPGKRGMAVNQAIENWLEEQRLIELRTHILEGLNDTENQAMSTEDERNWAPLSNEVWNRIEDEEWPEPAVIWPQGLKAEREKHGDKLDA